MLNVVMPNGHHETLGQYMNSIMLNNLISLKRNLSFESVTYIKLLDRLIRECGEYDDGFQAIVVMAIIPYDCFFTC